MSPAVTVSECSTPLLPGAGVGSIILLGPWMPMEVGALSDGFAECSTPAVAIAECATPAVALIETSTPPVTITEGGI